MNTIKIPGFTAQTSLYMGRQSYCGNIRAVGMRRDMRDEEGQVA
jgi:hypothetical protein